MIRVWFMARCFHVLIRSSILCFYAQSRPLTRAWLRIGWCFVKTSVWTAQTRDLTQQSSTKTDRFSFSCVRLPRHTTVSHTNTANKQAAGSWLHPEPVNSPFTPLIAVYFLTGCNYEYYLFTNSQSGNVLKNKELVCPDYPVTGSRICERCMWMIFHYKHSVSLNEQINIHAGTACQITLKHQDRHQSARNGRHEETTNTTQVLDLNLEGSLKNILCLSF